MSVRIDRIKLGTWMIRKGLTIADLAAAAGVSYVTASAVKSGRSCRLETAERIAEALGVPLRQLREESK
jgi:putative transcriptional regulator